MQTRDNTGVTGDAGELWLEDISLRAFPLPQTNWQDVTKWPRFCWVASKTCQPTYPAGVNAW